jgi:hypothetical protein
MLTEAQQELWDASLRAEGRAPRDDKVRALTAFLDRLVGSPEQAWFPWARSLAEAAVDRADSFVIRRPLFERAVFPALLAGYQDGLPGCARWLAGLFHLIGRSAGCLEQLPESQRSEVGLLRMALRHDPGDHRSRRRLLEILAERLRYSLHELPAGVLYGVDGASPEECLELERELGEFCALAREEGQDSLHGDLIERCRFHFRAYRDYLANPGPCRSYAEYLTRAGRRS